MRIEKREGGGGSRGGAFSSLWAAGCVWRKDGTVQGMRGRKSGAMGIATHNIVQDSVSTEQH